MAQFSVKKNKVDSVISEEGKLANELSSLEREIRDIGNSLGFQVAAKANIRNRLSSAANSISAHCTDMNNMRSALQDTINAYERTEGTILGNLNVSSVQTQNTLGVGYEGSGYGESTYDKFMDYLNGIIDEIDDGEYRDYIQKRLKDIADFLASLRDGSLDFSPEDLLFGLPAMLQGDIDAFDTFIDNLKDSIVDKAGFEAEAKVSGALFEGQISCENGSLGVSIGAYDAYASAEGGLLSKDKDGNIIFDPHIDAKVGASFTALEAAGAYAVGDEWMGAGVSGNVTVGKVSGEASASAGLRGEDGSFNPHAKVEASAEAILVDARAQAGVTVLGTEAEIEASVNVGIGAHANVEIGDGKIACDIGASLGIGASISFTIDYGGTVDAVKKATKGMAESVWNKVKWW